MVGLYVGWVTVALIDLDMASVVDDDVEVRTVVIERA